MSKHDQLDDANPFRALQKSRFRDAGAIKKEKPVPVRSSALPDDDDEAFAAAMGGVSRLDTNTSRPKKTQPSARPSGARKPQGSPTAAAGAIQPDVPATDAGATPQHAGTRINSTGATPRPAPSTPEAALRDKAGLAAPAGTFALGDHAAFNRLRQPDAQPAQDATSGQGTAPKQPVTPVQDAATKQERASRIARPARTSHPDVTTPERRQEVRDRSRHAVQHRAAAPAAPEQDDDDIFMGAMQGIKPLAGRGREITPEPTPERPAQAGHDPVQDFLEGRIEFALEYTAEYLEGHVVGLDTITIGKLRAGQYSPEAHLDLHGQNAAQAYDSLVGFFRGAYHKGLRTLLVIPGRGRNSPDGLGILREKLQEWLTHDPFKRIVLAFCTAQPTDGGAGAVYVLLRKYKKSRGKIQWDRRPSDPDIFL